MIDKSYDNDLAMAKATAPVYAEALAAAHDAFYATESSNSRNMMRNAIRAYLAASPSPSEMEVVTNLRSDAAQLLRMSKATAFGEDLSVRVTKPDLLIANMIGAADVIASVSAQVQRLTEENEALRKERDQLSDDLYEELEEAFTELEREADRHTHEVRAAKEFQSAKDAADHYRGKVTELCAQITTDKARIKALEDALNEIRELNTTGVDENGHRWSHSDLIDQVIIPLRLARTTLQKEQADG